ncbi:MAG: hypothetical protein HY782_18040 [Chloroflexi bacterium]|nr:hypothetical protein [Chloroflexota bacterium]
MTRWLDLNDLIAIRQLQRRGVALDLERAVLWPHSPLYAAFAAHLPFSPFGADTIILYPPAGRGRALGLIQVRQRPRRPEADITFIAPALDAREDAVSIWYRLLAECTQHIGERGGQRLFAQIAGGNGIEDVLRQSGFGVYAHEDVYRLADRPANVAKTNLLRRQRSRDTWNLMRLYGQTTPRPVQIAEGMLSTEEQGGKLRNWWDPSLGSGYVLPADRELAGAVRVQRGSAAYWLRFWLHPQAHDHAETLLRNAISLLWAAPRRPIYVSVRDYESGLRAPLEDLGFRYLYTRSLLVKHTTARVKEPFIKLVPALEKRAEPAASVAHHSNQ